MNFKVIYMVIIVIIASNIIFSIINYIRFKKFKEKKTLKENIFYRILYSYLNICIIGSMSEQYPILFSISMWGFTFPICLFILYKVTKSILGSGK